MTRRSGLGSSLVFCLFGATAVGGQAQLAPITAIVVDAAGRSVAGAQLTLTDPLGAGLAQALTDARGRATLTAPAPGRYRLVTQAPGAAPFDLPVAVAAALPIEITLRVPATVADEVIVEGRPPDEPSSRADLAADSLALVPTRIRGRAMQDAVATLPGWSTEDNGLLHARGVDDGFLYVIDGVPVYERLDALHGVAPDTASVSSLSVITGYVPPEFGHKAGGVIDVRSEAAGIDWSGVADARVGGDATLDGSAAGGGAVGPARVRLGIVAARSDRFLDPIHPDNLHNSGANTSTFGHVDWPAAAADRFTAGWGYGRSTFDVPNTDEQDEAAQDARQGLRQGYLQGTWQRSWSPRVVTQAAAYHRQSRARLEPSRFDTPLTASARRSLVRTGGLFAIAGQHGAHLLKLGLEYQRLLLDERFSFAITDEDEAEEAGFRDEARAFGRDRPFVFAGRATPWLWSVYAQDSWQATSRVSLSGGFRVDRSALLLARIALSPRAGTAIRIADDTVLRASVSRFFQPPQPENLLLSSSPEARVLSSIAVGTDEGGADLEPERQWAAEIGVEHRFARRFRVDVAFWHRAIEEVADPNVFAGTTIVFPNAVAEGRARGVDARLEASRRDGWSAYVNASVARVVQTGPITGGLFLEDEIEEIGPGVEFTPDHDQRAALAGGFSWTHARSRATLAAAVRYETGTPLQREDEDLDELLDRPGAELVDFARGRVKPRTVASILVTAPLVDRAAATAHVGVAVHNLFDDRYAYNFGNPFSGTHFGAPRTVAVTLRVTFR